MATQPFDDAGFGRVMRRTNDLARRVGEGTIGEEFVLAGIQQLSEGRDPLLLKQPDGKQIMSAPSADGLKRLVLEPDRPIGSWREVLGIKASDWCNDIQTLFAEPEPWEAGLAEVWYGIEAPGRVIWSLEAANLLYARDLHGFTQRMGFALAKAEPELVRKAPMPFIGSACRGSGGYLRVPYLRVSVSRLCADVYWGGSDCWSELCGFAGFRKL